MVSAVLGGVSLRTATGATQIYTTTSSTSITCWEDSLGEPGVLRRNLGRPRFQNPGDEAYSERKLQVRFDPLIGTSARITEGVKLQTSVDFSSHLISGAGPKLPVLCRTHRQSDALHRQQNHVDRTHSGS